MEDKDRVKLSGDAKKLVDRKLKEVLELSQIYKAPMFISFVTENDENGTKYDNIIYSAGAHNIELKNDLIRKFMLVCTGFEPVPPRNVVDIEMEPVEVVNAQDVLAGSTEN